MRVSGRVRTAPDGSDNQDNEDPEMNYKSLKNIGIIRLFAFLAPQKHQHFDSQGRIYLKVESAFFAKYQNVDSQG